MMDSSCEVLRKKDIRILWNVNEEGQINDIEVAEFTPERDPQHLYNHYSYDAGNCFSSWDKMSLNALVIDLFYRYGFENKDIATSFLLKASKIKEFHDEMMPFLNSVGLGIE